jgi:hypothetical protein
MENIIRAHNLGIPINYIELSPETQKELCRKTLDTAFNSMKVEAPMINRIAAIQRILDRSLKYAEDIQEYEACAIFRDLSIILKKEYQIADNKTTRKKKNPQDAK